MTKTTKAPRRQKKKDVKEVGESNKGGSSSLVPEESRMVLSTVNEIPREDGISDIDSNAETDGSPRNPEAETGHEELNSNSSEKDDEQEDEAEGEDEDDGEEDPNKGEEELDDEEEAMQPTKMHFPTSEYQKVIKLSGKCYIEKALSRIEAILNQKEFLWFKEHPQFQHFFHVKNPKQKWMGLWLVIVRTACVAKKYELWFIVNGVPIRYSLREVGLISGLYCHDYPPHHDRLGGTTFINKYFGEGKKVTYEDVEKKLNEMKTKPSSDRLKMAVLFFLTSVIVGGRKTGVGASPVDSFFLRVVDDLDVCKKFPWGRYAFEANMNDVTVFLEKCNGVVPTSWVITSFPVPLELLAFEAIPSLRNYYREPVNGADSECPRMCKMRYKRKGGGTKSFSLREMNGKLGETTEDIESILVATPAEEKLLKRVMGKGSVWADDTDDPAVDRWTKILRKGKKQICFSILYENDLSARTRQVEAPAIGAGAEQVQVENPTPAVESPGDRELKEVESRVMNALRVCMEEVNQKIEGVVKRVSGLEEEVKNLAGIVSENISSRTAATIAQQMLNEHGSNLGETQSESTDTAGDGGGKEKEVDDEGEGGGLREGGAGKGKEVDAANARTEVGEKSGLICNEDADVMDMKLDDFEMPLRTFKRQKTVYGRSPIETRGLQKKDKNGGQEVAKKVSKKVVKKVVEKKDKKRGQKK